MADFNGITRPQAGIAVPRLYGVEVPRVTSVSGEVQVTTSPFELPEQWALFGGALCAGSVSSGVVANQPFCALYNPAASGVLLVVERITPYNAAAGTQEIGVFLYRGFLAGSVGNWGNRDTRRVSGVQTQGGTVGAMMFDNLATAPAGSARLWRGPLPTNTYADIYMDLVLSPGWSVLVNIAASGVQLHCSFSGRERPVSDAELNL